MGAGSKARVKVYLADGKGRVEAKDDGVDGLSNRFTILRFDHACGMHLTTRLTTGRRAGLPVQALTAMFLRLRSFVMNFLTRKALLKAAA
jgi:hypothetical protein